MWRYLHTTVACRLTVQCISNTFKVKWYWVTPCLWKHYRERRMIFFNKNQKLYIQIFMFAVHESKYPQNISINLFFFIKMQKKDFYFLFKQKTTLEFSVKKSRGHASSTEPQVSLSDVGPYTQTVSTDLLKFSRLCQRWDLKFLMFWASSRIR